MVLPPALSLEGWDAAGQRKNGEPGALVQVQRSAFRAASGTGVPSVTALRTARESRELECCS